MKKLIIFTITLMSVSCMSIGKMGLDPSPENIKQTRNELWNKYLEKVRNDPVRKKEHEERALPFNGKVMKYVAKKVTKDKESNKKLPLYIAMHGGGECAAKINDSQWKQMQVYYLPNVKEGIYVATRGVTNNWNLHFRKESYPLYDRLIENMIAFENVDPNRVYLLGYSAGGDGVYQISARMPDRWAAANMSAGHHNNVPPENRFNLPFLMQVGQNDNGVKRNKASVEYYLKLQKLAKNNPGLYPHDLYVHFRRGHNFLDNHPTEAEQLIIETPEKLLEKGGKSRVIKKNTSAINWLKQYTRNPIPKKIIWNLKATCDRSGKSKEGTGLWNIPNKGKQFYWLDLMEVPPKEAGTEKIIAAYDKATNTITVSGKPKKLRILLNEEMVDFSKDITVKVDGQTFTKSVNPSLETMKRTLGERGDPNYIFAGEIVLPLGKSDPSTSLRGGSKK